MFKLLIIGLGGFPGALGRYGVSGLVHRYANASFPTGTLVVNLLGCLLIGGLLFLAESRQFFTPEARLFLLVGVLGSFTTLSTVGYETFEFLRAGDLRLAVVNAGANCFWAVDHEDRGRRPVVEDLHRRERPMGGKTSLRSDRPESARARSSWSDRASRAGGIRRS